ncbi:PIG-X [Mycena haematopus]|nr:PIG-X [Mycena haematopus]
MVFVDPYELSNRADAYSFKYYAGPSNLELPVFALSGDGDEENAVLLLTVSQPLSADGVLDVEVPLHTRYGSTRVSTSESSTGSFQLTQLPWPDAFLACPASASTGADSQLLPIMRPEFTAAFGKTVIFRLSPPLGAIPVETIRTPVGDASHVGPVEVGTAVTVLVAFFYLVRAVRRTIVRLGSPNVVVHLLLLALVGLGPSTPRSPPRLYSSKRPKQSIRILGAESCGAAADVHSPLLLKRAAVSGKVHGERAMAWARTDDVADETLHPLREPRH